VISMEFVFPSQDRHAWFLTCGKNQAITTKETCNVSKYSYELPKDPLTVILFKLEGVPRLFVVICTEACDNMTEGSAP
jgi:hypothetical protein